MKKVQLLLCVLALSLIGSACGLSPIQEQASSAPRESGASSSGGIAILPEESSSSSEESLSSSTSEEAPPSSASSAPSSVPESFSQSSSDPQVTQPVGMDLIQGREVTLSDWQWIDKNRLLLMVSYNDPQKTMRGVLVDRRSADPVEMGCFIDVVGEVSGRGYENYVEFLVDGLSLKMDRPDGVDLYDAQADDYSDLLPEAWEEFTYSGIQFSFDRKYYFYERYAVGTDIEGVPASDRIYVENAGGNTDKSPLAEFAFPFDVRTSPKSICWMNGCDDILVQADIPQKEEYEKYRRTYYVLDAPLGETKATFTLDRDDYTLMDTYRTKLLLEKADEPYTLICYDYKTGKTQKVVTLEGQKGETRSAKFSPDGKEIALLRTATDLTPQFFPVSE